MQLHVPEEHEELVKTVCKEIVEKPERSNFVKLKELRANSEIRETITLSENRPRKLGYILTHSDWAEKWSTGTYMVDL